MLNYLNHRAQDRALGENIMETGRMKWKQKQ